MDSFYISLTCTIVSRILKTGIRLEGVVMATKIWLTCCALHNMLLEIDGLTEPWDGDMGYHDSSKADRCIPRGIAVDHDLSGIGPGEDAPRGIQIETNNNAEIEFDETQLEPVRTVRCLSRSFFRKRLIEHFAIRYKEGTVHWTARGKSK